MNPFSIDWIPKVKGGAKSIGDKVVFTQKLSKNQKAIDIIPKAYYQETTIISKHMHVSITITCLSTPTQSRSEIWE